MKKKKDNIEAIDELFDISDIKNRAEIEKENVVSVGKELTHVKCPKCGYMNFELSRKCTKCRYDLDFVNKSCPKCGRIHANAVKKCGCGFDFNKKKRSLLINLILTLLIMGVIFIVMNNYADVLKKYDMVVKVLLIYVVFVFLCRMFISSNPYEGFGAEHEMLEQYKRKTNPKLKRNLMIVFGFVVAVGFLVYYYYFK